MQAPVHHIVPLATIVRERVLPVRGLVTARVSQKVSAADVVVQAKRAREHVLLDVARVLRLSPTAAERLVKVRVGDELKPGTVIATGRGLFGRSVVVPKAGHVVAVGGGQVLLEVAATRWELRAGIPGTVIQIVPERGVIIQTTGALVQGLWGNGRIDAGQLVNLADRPDSLLTASRLDASLRGSVILAGIVREAQTLQAAAGLPVRGLILASLPSGLIQTAREMRYPILATDGIGTLPMNSAAHKLLSTSAQREVSVNAEPYNRQTGAHPEVVIALPVAQPPPIPPETEELAPGLQVRILRPPAAGAIGTIVTIRPGLTVLPSGVRAAVAMVKIENGDTVIVPLANLDVVG